MEGVQASLRFLTASLMTIDHLLAQPTTVHVAISPAQSALGSLAKILDRNLELLASPARPRAEGYYFESDMREAAGLSASAGFPKPPVVFTDKSCTLHDVNGTPLCADMLDSWDWRPASEYQDWRERSLIPHLRRWRAVVNDRLDGPALLPPSATTHLKGDATAKTPLGSEPPEPVELRGVDEGPVVNGKVKPRLTLVLYNTIAALLKAKAEGTGRMLGEQLAQRSGHPDCVRHLNNLARGDADWRSVLLLPNKKKGAGYGIR